MSISTLVKDASFTDILLRASELRQRGELAGALSLYHEALRQFGATPELLAALGEVRFEMALRDPKDSGAGYGEVIDIVGRAIDLAPTNGYLHALLGQVYWLGLLDHAKAFIEFRKAIEINPCDARSVALIVGLHGPPEAEEVLTLEEAIKYGKGAAELQPSLPEHHFNLGSLYREAGNADAAAVEYVKALLCPAALEQRMIDSIRALLKDLRGGPT